MYQTQQLSKFGVHNLKSQESSSSTTPNYAKGQTYKKDLGYFHVASQQNETGDDSGSKRDKPYKQNTLIQEILSANNGKKIEKLIELYISQPSQETLEYLNQYELVNLYFRVAQYKSNESVMFQQSIYECLLTQNKNEQIQSVIKYMLLNNYEQVIGKSGQMARLLEILQEMTTLDPDFKTFEDQFQLSLDEVHISFARIQLRTLFLISSLDVLKALKGSVSLFEQYENYVFSSIKQNAIPSECDLGTLVIAYVLLSEQLDLALKCGFQKEALEIVGKSQDLPISEFRKKFLSNASKLSLKYLGQSIFNKINLIQRKQTPELTKSSLTHIHISQQQENSCFSFLTEALDMNYYLEAQKLFELDRKADKILNYSILQQLLDKILPEGPKKVKSGSIIHTEETKKISIKKEQSMKNQFKRVESSNSVNSPKTYKIKTNSSSGSSKFQQQQQQQQECMNQQMQAEHQELENIQHELIKQKKELDQLRQLYSSQINVVQKNEQQYQQNSSYQQQQQQQQQQIQQTDQLKKKIELLENNLQQLKTENSNYKREKDNKQIEVNDLKGQLQELFEKYSKIEKIISNQQIQQQSIQPQTISQSPNYLKTSGHSSKMNTQTTMNIQIPDENKRSLFQRGQSQMSNSPVDNFNLIQDDNSPHQSKQNAAYILSLLELLDINYTFTKNYVKFQSQAVSDQALWDSDFTIQQLFKIEGTIQETKEEGKSLYLKAYQSNQILCQETVPFEILKNLVTYVDFQEMLPTNLPNISNTHQFFKYFILPFTAVTQDENSQQYKIQLWPKSCGLLNGLNLKIDFLDYNCLVFLNHIENDQFRILICDPVSYGNLKIDLEMDYSSMDAFFKDVRQVKDEYSFFNKSTLLRMTEKTPKFGEDDVAEALQERHFSKEKCEGIQQEQKNQSYQTEYLVLKSPIEFLKYIKSIVTQFENKLKTLQMSFSQTILGMNYFRIKTWNAGTRSQIQVVKDHTDQQSIDIYLQNCFESFAPNKSKLKVKGQTSLSYWVLQREFSVNYEKLQFEEKLAIIQQLLYSFNLNIFEKQCEQTEQQFDRNPIIQSTYECGSYKKTIVFDNGKITPVTMQVIGSNRRMCGVKFSVYSIEDNLEYGVFLPTSQNEWDMRAIDKQKIKSSVQNVPFAEFLLTQILKCQVVQQILFKKILNSDPKTNQINSTEIKRRKTFIERIDNLITWQEVLANV